MYYLMVGMFKIRVFLNVIYTNYKDKKVVNYLSSNKNLYY